MVLVALLLRVCHSYIMYFKIINYFQHFHKSTENTPGGEGVHCKFVGLDIVANTVPTI